ncbi:MAG: hypothetical protein ACPHVJ_07050 [Psychrobacter sp.]
MSKYAPYDIHTNPASLKAFLVSVPSVVLNTTTNSLVLIPLGNLDMLEIAGLAYDEDLELMTTDDAHYSELTQVFVMPTENHSEIAVNYFIQRCIEACRGEVPRAILHEESYRHIYDGLVENEINIIDIIKRIPMIIEKYHELSVFDVVYGGNKVCEGVPTADDIDLAIKTIENTEVSGKRFELCYRVHEGSAAEDVVILYQKVN